MAPKAKTSIWRKAFNAENAESAEKEGKKEELRGNPLFWLSLRGAPATWQSPKLWGLLRFARNDIPHPSGKNSYMAGGNIGANVGAHGDAPFLEEGLGRTAVRPYITGFRTFFLSFLRLGSPRPPRSLRCNS